MCGIVGVAGNLFQKDEGLITSLLLMDYLRGKDGSGLASVRSSGEIRVAKIANDPITLFNTLNYKDVNSGAASKVLLGHNRYATRGEKTNNNAHPFHHEHIVGAHNGTLEASSWFAIENALGQKFGTDSEALIAAISYLGVKEAINLCTEGSDASTGAWSLVWYDKIEDSLNFLRNKHRPMWYGFEKDLKRLIWASEWWMIEAAMRIAEIEPYIEEGTRFKFFPTEEDVHMKFDVGLITKGDEKSLSPKTNPVKGKEPPVVVQGNFPIKQHGNSCGFGPAGKNKQTGSTILTTKSPSNVLHWLGTTASPLAGYISEEKFNEIAKYGCSWCQSDVHYGDVGIAIYERDDMLLCAKCVGNDEVDEKTATRIYASPNKFAAIQ